MQGSRGVIWAALALAACSSQEQAGAPDNAAANQAASRFAGRMVGTPPATPPAQDFKRSEKTGLLEFDYGYPAAAAAIPALASRFGHDMERSHADALKMAQDDSAAAKDSGFPFRGHSLSTQWTVTADTPRFLALESESYVFTGGAHGMTGYDVALWDKARKTEILPRALMTSADAFAGAVQAPFCDQLDKMRAEKRGGPIVRNDDPFNECIDPMEQVIVPMSSDGKRIDALRFVVGPYSAGPYSEGTYDVDLPVDANIRAVIRPDYRDAFAGG